MLADRITKVAPSATLAISAKAKQMQKDGIKVIDFGVGEPDFDTPQYIKDKAIESLQAGFTKYTPAGGTNELKAAVAGKFKKDQNLDYKLDEIVISCGAKHSLYNIMQVLVNKGDEVILQAPYWVSYIEQIKLAQGVPVVIDTSKSGFKLDAKRITGAITPKTKLLILNSPSNPTGAVYTENEIKKLAEVIVKGNFFVISDEIYEKFIYDNEKHYSIACFSKEMKEKTLLVNGVSKTYSMTGWRIGYTAGKSEIISAVAKLQSHSTSNPTSFAQTAAVEAINGPQQEVGKMVDAFNKRRLFILDRLNKIKGVSCLKPEGAFYAFPDISGLFGLRFKDRMIKSSSDLTELLLSEAKVAVVPGKEFGTDNFIRLSYATSMENIETGLDMIETFVRGLK